MKKKKNTGEGKICLLMSFPVMYLSGMEEKFVGFKCVFRK